METVEMEELAAIEELAKTEEGTGEVEMVERTLVCLPPECADGEKLPPRGFQAPRIPFFHVRVAQVLQEVS